MKYTLTLYTRHPSKTVSLKFLLVEKDQNTPVGKDTIPFVTSSNAGSRSMCIFVCLSSQFLIDCSQSIVATAFEMKPFISAWRVNPATHIFGITLPTCRSQGMPGPHSCGPVPNASSILSQQAFLIYFPPLAPQRVFMDHFHYTKPPLSNRATFCRNLAHFFSFFGPRKIFDVSIFVLETAPSLIKAKGSVLFGMLCNLEFAEKHGL